MWTKLAAPGRVQEQGERLRPKGGGGGDKEGEKDDRKLRLYIDMETDSGAAQPMQGVDSLMQARVSVTPCAGQSFTVTAEPADATHAQARLAT